MTTNVSTVTERTPIGMKHWKFHDVESTIGKSDEDAAAVYSSHGFKASCVAPTETEAVTSAYSRDGRLFACASDGGTARVEGDDDDERSERVELFPGFDVLVHLSETNIHGRGEG
jgi:hypothetical protein